MNTQPHTTANQKQNSKATTQLKTWSKHDNKYVNTTAKSEKHQLKKWQGMVLIHCHMLLADWLQCTSVWETWKTEVCRMLRHNMSLNESTDAFIRCNFYSVHSYDFIVDMLSTLHRINMSTRTLKTCLKEARLFRRKNCSSL